MLQTYKPGVPAVQAEADSFSDFGSAGQLLAAAQALIWRQLPVMAVIFALAIALGVLFVLTTPPRYTATGSLIIDSRKSQLLQQQTPVGVDLPVDSATVDSQVEILNSESVALSVIKDLRLMDEPEFTGPGGGLIGTVIGGISDLFGAGPKSEYELSRKALERFAGRLTVKRLGLSYVIEISFQSTDAQRAARIVNAVAEAYIQDSLEAKYQSSHRAATWLQDRLKELRTQASTAERAVVDFKAKNNIVDAGGRLLNEQQLAEINSALIAARAQRAESQARVERIDSILQTAQDDKFFNDTATVAETLRNEVITRLRQQYLDLAARESDWSSKYGADHLAAVNLRNQMREIRRSIADELRRVAETYKSDLAIAKAREEAVQKSLDEIVAQSTNTNRAQVTLRELESTSQSYRALADNFLQLYMISVQQQSFPLTEARLITQGSAALKPSFPKLWAVALISVVGGGIMAFGAGVLRDITDRVFRTGSQVETTLGIDCLAVLPIIAPVRRRFRKLAASEVAGPEFTAHGILSHVVDQPFSRFTEGVRSIKVAADLRALSNTNKVIGVTSSLPDEGKSTTAVSLARVMTHGGARTILVDCDLRNPSLSHRLAPDAKMGLLEVLTGQATLEEVLIVDPATNLRFLPTISKERISHSSEVLASNSTAKLFEQLREEFDYVVLDLSPLAPIVDVRSTARLVDSYVYVVEWGRTKIDLVERALREARIIQKAILGIVLNKTDIKLLSRYESYRGNYYYGRYHSRYGHDGV
jgi:succinoglycan biosynthesis transport protein ExoP